MALSQKYGAQQLLGQGDTMLKRLWFLLGLLLACDNNQAPVASFSVNVLSGPPPLTVLANATASYDPDGFIQEYIWDWGDFTPPDFGPQAQHTYTNPGAYTLTLTITDNSGSSSRQTALVRVLSGNSLQHDPAVNLGGYLSDQYTWLDSQGQPRSAALVRNNQGDPRGAKGGYLERFTYTLPGGGTREVRGANGFFGGFGYIVSHLKDPSTASGEDDSPLGHQFGGQYRTVFVGAHHALHEFTLNYPRWGRVNNQRIKYQVPVTIQWLFATGKDHPLWSTGFDLSVAPAGAINADTRAPYGELYFDGGFDTVGGVAWGERFHFESTSKPLTLNSDWTWSQSNSGAPYNLLFTQNTDAEMGLVGTRVIGKQDAGGYEGGDGRGSTSANATQRCNTSQPTYRMPCDWKWPFQSVNYSFYNNQGQLDPNTPTASKRLAWGSDWGFLGQSSYSSINGFVGSGHPQVGYSVWVVLGTHSANPTRLLAQQMRTVDQTTLSATGATVRSGGPLGVGLSQSTTYSPIGYNPTYGTWEANLGAATVQLSFSVPAGQSLERPMLRLHGANQLPNSISLNATALVADTDYFASLDSSTGQLWITLARNLQGQAQLSLLF